MIRTLAGVYVWDIIGNNGKGEDDKEESATPAHPLDEWRAQETADFVGVIMLLPGRLGSECCHCCCSKELDGHHRH